MATGDTRDRRKRVHYAPNMRNCRASNIRQARAELRSSHVRKEVTCLRCLALIDSVTRD